MGYGNNGMEDMDEDDYGDDMDDSDRSDAEDPNRMEDGEGKGSKSAIFLILFLEKTRK